MRITILLEVADQLSAEVKVALEDANWLSRNGHQVTVVSRSPQPSWMQLDCAFSQVPDFRPEHLPDGEVLVGTHWTTVPWAASAGPAKGAPVRYCQGYEGDQHGFEDVRDRIESAYRLPGVHHVATSPALASMLSSRFGIEARDVGACVDAAVHRPGPLRRPQSPLRVGLVGSYASAVKDLATGYAACQLAHEAGQELVLVRASNEPPTSAEQDLPFEVEWHQDLAPEQMGDLYRSLDVFLGTSKGVEEELFLPAIEAMACGVPCVLTDIPCFRSHEQEVGHDRYALFVAPKDARAMAEAIVLAGALPDVRATLRGGGVEVAGRYQQQHGQRLEAALQEIATAYAASTASSAPTTPRSTPAIPRAATGERRDLRLVQPAGDAAQDSDTASLQDLGAALRHAAAGAQAAGRLEDAARSLAAARCLDEGDLQLWFETARAWLAAGRPEHALATLDQQRTDEQDEALLQRLRADALHSLGRMQDAAQAVRASIAAGARNADTYNLLGVTLFQAGRTEDARESFERALVLEPDHADARANLDALPAA